MAAISKAIVSPEENLMYSDIFCKVYNEFGWNYYPEEFGAQLLLWLVQHQLTPKTSMDLACGTGILCGILQKNGIEASGMDLSEGMIRIARENYPELCFEAADMITYRPNKTFDLVTCTGDALNHIPRLEDVTRIFENVYACLNPGGHFIFDILNKNEVSSSEPFEMDFQEDTRIWFQMTQPEADSVNLKIRVFENDKLKFEENIQEKIHDPQIICQLLQKCGFQIIKCADHLPDHTDYHGTTWFVIARKDK